MDPEIKSFIKIWSIAITSLIYCYYISSRIPKGILRLISISPVLYLFFTLPLDLHSVHLGAPTVFFLVWLSSFKLILFSFDQPPLSPLPNNPFHFISIACLPIKLITTKQDTTTKITQNPPPNLGKDSIFSPSSTNPPQTIGKDSIFSQSNTNPPQNFDKVSIFSQSNTNPSENSKSQRNPTSHVDSKVSWPIPMPIKVLLLALIVEAYEYRPYLNSHVTLMLYIWHMYLGIELVLALCALPAKTILGFEIEPQFNEPYLLTSLQDYWGRRWNLMVSAILKPTAYEPMKRLATPILGPTWAHMMGFVWAFTVSGLMHELIYYYLLRARPTWEVTWFFVLHGVCTAAEVAFKRWARGRWRLSNAVSGGLTWVFLIVSGNWLFFPQIIRGGVIEKAIKEYGIMVDFVMKLVRLRG